MCLTFHIRVGHFFGMPKKKSIYDLRETSMFTFTIFFPQAYLIWASKLDVHKICIQPIISPKLTLSYAFSAFYLRKVSSLTSKPLPARRCSNVVVLLCTGKTEGTKPDKNTGWN